MSRHKISINCELGQFFVATEHELSRHKFYDAQIELCYDIKKSCCEIFSEVHVCYSSRRK